MLDHAVPLHFPIAIRIIMQESPVERQGLFQKLGDVTKKGTEGTIFFKKTLRHILNKINRDIIQKSGAVVAQNSPGNFFLLIG